MEKQREYQGRRKRAASSQAKKPYIYKFFIQCLVSLLIWGLSVAPLKTLDFVQSYIKTAITYKVDTNIINSTLSKLIKTKADKNIPTDEVQKNENETYTQNTL